MDKNVHDHFRLGAQFFLKDFYDSEIKINFKSENINISIILFQ